MVFLSSKISWHTNLGQIKKPSKWPPFNQRKSAHVPLTGLGCILAVKGEGWTEKVFRHCVKGFRSIRDTAMK